MTADEGGGFAADARRLVPVGGGARERSARDGARHDGFGWLTWLLLAAGATPLVLAWPVPLQDWPNHVAGAHVLAALLDGDPFWQQFYVRNTFLIPNAAMDLGLLSLRALGCSEPVAANLFLMLTYGVFVGGMTLLSRALAGFDLVKAAAAVLLFYGAALFWGLANYVLGMGLMWAILGLWLGLAARPAARLGVAGLGAVVLLFAHAVPAVVLPLLFGCFDAAPWRSGTRLWRGASAPLALALVVLVMRWLPGDTGRDLSLVYTGAAGPIAFAGWKLRIFATTLLGGSRLQDAASLVALAGSALALAGAARVRLALGAAIGVVALTGLALVAPERMGTGSLLDVRLAVLPLMLVAAAARVSWRSEAARRACQALIALLVVGRTAVIAADWRQAATVFAAFESEASRLPPGSIMMMAYGRRLDSLTWTDIWSPPIQSIAAPVVARFVFFPALFANPDQQPIALRPEFQSLVQPWNFSDPDHRTASLVRLAEICASRRYSGVFVTILYGGPAFSILDACA